MPKTIQQILDERAKVTKLSDEKRRWAVQNPYQPYPFEEELQKLLKDAPKPKVSPPKPPVKPPAPTPKPPEKAPPAPKAAAPEPLPKQPTVKPDLIIHRTPYPKWWNDEGIAKISLTSPGSQFVITAKGDYSLYIATIVFTVSGECDITLSFGSAGSSGSMNFGGEDEPRGIVIATGNSPTPCGSGSFMITASSDEAVTIGGYVSYYLWKK